MSGDSNVFWRGQTGSSASRASHRFLRHAANKQPTYQSDEASLLPVPTKTGGRIEVGLAEATAVSIKSVGEKTRNYTTTERPALRFRGVLKVAAVEAETEEVFDTSSEDDSLEEKPFDVNDLPEGATDLPVIHRRGRGPLHKVNHQNHKVEAEPEHSSGVVAVTRPIRLNRNPASDTLIVNAPRSASRFQSVATLLLVLLFVSGLAVTLFGASASVVVEGDTVVESYHFSVRRAWEIVRSQLPALLVKSF